MLIYILISTLLISLISLVGVAFLGLNENLLKEITEDLISIASGGLLGGAFIHLLPEAMETGGSNMFIYVMVGVMFFFVLEKYLKWRHCHETDCELHAFTYLSLVGDGIHNFFDGVVVAAAYMTSMELGVATTIAVVLHEIPQEIGDFAILIYGGFSKARALFFNFLIALTAFAGTLAAYFLLSYVNNIQPMLLAMTAGGFIYVALVDLVPELHKKWSPRASFSQTLLLVAGICLMFVMKMFFKG